MRLTRRQLFEFAARAGAVAGVARRVQAQVRPTSAGSREATGKASPDHRDVFDVPETFDDTQVSPLRYGQVAANEVYRDENGQPIPESDRVRVITSRYSVILGGGEHTRIESAAKNPFFGPPGPPPCVLGHGPRPLEPLGPHQSDPEGPLTEAERSLAVWLAFSAVHTTHPILERWAARRTGQITIDVGGLGDSKELTQACYSPHARVVLLGSIRARDPATGRIGRWSLAQSRDAVIHEAGHAQGDVLKPNAWSLFGSTIEPEKTVTARFEDHGDQVAMWSSLLLPGRIEALLASTGGNLRGPNALSLIAEGVARLTFGWPGIRDASASKRAVPPVVQKMFGTSTFEGTLDFVALALIGGPSMLGEGLLQISYACFVDLFEQRVREGTPPSKALEELAEVMGTLSTRMFDYLPENDFSAGDIARAYLAADRHLFGGRHGPTLLRHFLAHPTIRKGMQNTPERKVPDLSITRADVTPSAMTQWLDSHREALGTPKGFYARVQEIVDQTGARVPAIIALDDGRTLVRTQLFRRTQPLLNHGNLVFAPDGKLESAHPAFPPSLDPKRVGRDFDKRLTKGSFPVAHLPAVVPTMENGKVVHKILGVLPRQAPRRADPTVHSLMCSAEDRGDVLSELEAP